MSVGYLTARENEVELLTTKVYNLHSILLVLKSFIINRFATKSREFS